MTRSNTYRGRLQLDKSDLLEVDLRVVGNEVILVSKSGRLGEWSIHDVGVVRIDSDKFELDLDGESAIFLADDVLAFSYEAVGTLGSPTRISKWRRERRRRQESGAGANLPRPSVNVDKATLARARETSESRPVVRQLAKSSLQAVSAFGGFAKRVGSSAFRALHRFGEETSRSIGSKVAAAKAQREMADSSGQPPRPTSESEAVAPERFEAAARSEMPRHWNPKGLLRTSGKAAFSFLDLFLGQWPGPRILIYHQVGTETGRQMEVTYEAFQAQIAWMLEVGNIVRLEDALRLRGTSGADRLFVLTFDDGYADLFDVAYPVLEQDGIPFTVYLTTEHIETGVELAPDRSPLTWESVVKMADNKLMTLGAHTHRHQDLRGASLDQIEDELSLSDELIKERTGITPAHFAYPWGYWSPIADTVVRRRYESAVLGAGDPVVAATDPYLVHRLPIQRSDGFYFFQRKALRGMRLEEGARRIVRGYRGP